MTSIRDRIVELRRVRAGDLFPDPRNWRRHSKAQRDALKGILQEIGYADALLARKTPEGLCLSVGISEDTFYGWMRRGAKAIARGEDTQFAQFFKAIKEAQAVSEIRLVAGIRRAVPAEWQAGAWLLERKFPDRWGRREKVTIEMKVQEIKVEVYTVVVQAFVALFNETNQLPDLEQRHAAFAIGADRIIEAAFQEKAPVEVPQ